MPAPFRTHEVLNQPPPLEDYNVFLADRALQEGLEREGGAAAREDIIAMGAEAGSRRMIELGDLANRHLPELKAFDRFGHRIDEVEFHPAYHELMAHAKRRRLHSRPWVDPGQGSHVARAAAYICRHQIEEGVSCPITMTFAAVPTLRLQPEIAKAWLPRLM
ncbi:MAG: DNA alkylation response protein, partial [Alphaproteobacteria bacterium]|nr:DNA alkylation response protein [Alphaproteobacteria bacterium]